MAKRGELSVLLGFLVIFFCEGAERRWLEGCCGTTWETAACWTEIDGQRIIPTKDDHVIFELRGPCVVYFQTEVVAVGNISIHRHPFGSAFARVTFQGERPADSGTVTIPVEFMTLDADLWTFAIDNLQLSVNETFSVVAGAVECQDYCSVTGRGSMHVFEHASFASAATEMSQPRAPDIDILNEGMLDLVSTQNDMLPSITNRGQMSFLSRGTRGGIVSQAGSKTWINEPPVGEIQIACEGGGEFDPAIVNNGNIEIVAGSAVTFRALFSGAGTVILESGATLDLYGGFDMERGTLFEGQGHIRLRTAYNPASSMHLSAEFQDAVVVEVFASCSIGNVDLKDSSSMLAADPDTGFEGSLLIAGESRAGVPPGLTIGRSSSLARSLGATATVILSSFAIQNQGTIDLSNVEARNVDFLNMGAGAWATLRGVRSNGLHVKNEGTMRVSDLGFLHGAVLFNLPRAALTIEDSVRCARVSTQPFNISTYPLYPSTSATIVNGGDVHVFSKPDSSLPFPLVGSFTSSQLDISGISVMQWSMPASSQSCVNLAIAHDVPTDPMSAPIPTLVGQIYEWTGALRWGPSFAITVDGLEVSIVQNATGGGIPTRRADGVPAGARLPKEMEASRCVIQCPGGCVIESANFFRVGELVYFQGGGTFENRGSIAFVPSLTGAVSALTVQLRFVNDGSVEMCDGNATFAMGFTQRDPQAHFNLCGESVDGEMQFDEGSFEGGGYIQGSMTMSRGKMTFSAGEEALSVLGRFETGPETEIFMGVGLGVENRRAGGPSVIVLRYAPCFIPTHPLQ